MSADNLPAIRPERPAWNKGRILRQKRPLLQKHVWSVRVRLEMADNRPDLALFNMAVDSKLRGCDLVCLKVRVVIAAGGVKERASVTQGKTGKPVRFEITETTRQSLARALERRAAARKFVQAAPTNRGSPVLFRLEAAYVRCLGDDE